VNSLNGHATGIGPVFVPNAAPTYLCGHHTHTDADYLRCLAAAHRATVPQLRALLLAALLSDAEDLHRNLMDDLASDVARARQDVMDAIHGATDHEPAQLPAPKRVRRPKSPTAATPAQRHPIVRALLRDNPDAGPSDVREALAAAGFHVSASCASNDLRAVRS
jgi:hypothetical protein